MLLTLRMTMCSIAGGLSCVICLFTNMAYAGKIGVPPPIVWTFTSNIEVERWEGVIVSESVNNNTYEHFDAWQESIHATYWPNGRSDITTEGGFFPSRFSANLALDAVWDGRDAVTAWIQNLADYDIRAWVRAAPGTDVNMKKTRSASIDAWKRGRGIGYGHEHSNLQSTVSETEVIDVLTHATTTTSEFPDFPGVVYSQVLLDVAANRTIEHGGLFANLNYSGFDNRPEFDGLLQLAMDIELSIQEGVSPVPGFIRTEGGTHIPLGHTSLFQSTSFDPDDGTTPGDGIIFYEWYANGESAQVGSSAAFAFQPLEMGSVEIALVVTDTEGQRERFAQTYTVVIPEPMSVTLVCCGLWAIACIRLRSLRVCAAPKRLG